MIHDIKAWSNPFALARGLGYDLSRIRLCVVSTRDDVVKKFSTSGQLCDLRCRISLRALMRGMQLQEIRQ